MPPVTPPGSPVASPAPAGAPGCVFCAIVAGHAPAHVVHADEHTVAFLDLNPASAGHTLVVPRTHAENLHTIDPVVAGHVFTAAAVVSQLLHERLHPDGLTVVQTNGRAGWQDVFHLHVHLVPRWTGDELVRPWTPKRASRTELARVSARILCDS